MARAAKRARSSRVREEPPPTPLARKPVGIGRARYCNFRLFLTAVQNLTWEGSKIGDIDGRTKKAGEIRRPFARSKLLSV
jgi:hypothetical protein